MQFVYNHQFVYYLG